MASQALNKKILYISAFDLDYTLFSENSSYCFGRYLCSKKFMSLFALGFIIGCNIRHATGLLPIEKLHETAFNRLFKGRLADVVKNWASDFLNEHFEKLLYSPALEKLKLAQAAGHLTLILSSTPDFLVEPIAKKLNVSDWKATQYAVDKDQKFCHIHQLILGRNKASILEELSSQYEVPKQNIYAYSDSDLDLPFLMAAGTAIGVNPNKKLRSICREKNWPII